MPTGARELLTEFHGETWLMEPRRLERMFAKLGRLAREGFVFAAGPAAGGDPGYTILEGVAHIDIRGVILKDDPGFFWDEITSAVATRDAVLAALADPQARSILLTVDSPGGTVAGVQELADAVYAGRAQKPIAAFCSDLCASAAYWVASQANRVRANETAEIGSIGAYSLVVDSSKFFEEMGFKSHLIASGPHKGMGSPGVAVEDSQLKIQQQLIDQLAGLFVAAVARGRGLETTAVEALATGRCWIAADAKRLGLIDEVTTADGAHAAAKTMRRSAAPKETKMELDEILASLPDDQRATVQQALANAKSVAAPPADPEANLPEEARRALTEARATAAAAAAREAALAKRIEDLEEARLAGEYEAKAAKLTHLPGLSKADVGQILRAAERGTAIPKELGAKLSRALAGIDEAMSRSKIFDEFGTTGAAADASPLGQLEAKAKELQAREPTLTYEQAFARTTKEHRGLYAAYRDAARQGAAAE